VRNTIAFSSSARMIAALMTSDNAAAAANRPWTMRSFLRRRDTPRYVWRFTQMSP
jgi:hypothetical protein